METTEKTLNDNQTTNSKHLQDFSDQAIALSQHLNNETLEQLIDCDYDNFIEKIGEAQDKIDDKDYLVLTDEEADDRREEEIESYFDECIQPELDKIGGNIGTYFDYEARKRDAEYDWRGYSIASYDGKENEETVNEKTYYIYRMN